MSKFRPDVPHCGRNAGGKTFHQLSLSWGVYPVIARYQNTTDQLFVHAVDCAKQIDLVADGDRVVVVAEFPRHPRQHQHSQGRACGKSLKIIILPAKSKLPTSKALSAVFIFFFFEGQESA